MYPVPLAPLDLGVLYLRREWGSPFLTCGGGGGETLVASSAQQETRHHVPSRERSHLQGGKERSLVIASTPGPQAVADGDGDEKAAWARN